jgi:hypothetical protein
MKKIIPGEGNDVLKFGMSKTEVEKLKGKPTEKETLSESNDEPTIEVWHYDEEESSLSFEGDEEGVLIAIAVSSDQWILEDTINTGMQESDLIEMLEKMDIGEYDTEDMSDEENPKQFLYYFTDQNISFWIDNGVLSEIQWGPFWDENKQDFAWPS